MKKNFVKKTGLLLFLLAAGFIVYFSYEHFAQTKPLIRPFNEEKDFAPIVSIINKDHFLLSERRDFTAERALLWRSPGDDASKKGLADIDVIEWEGQTAGFIAYYKKSFEEGTIWLLSVGKDFRGKGFAKSLMLHALAKLKDKKVSFVSIATRTINKPALSLYKKLGFKEIERYEERGMVILKKTF